MNEESKTRVYRDQCAIRVNNHFKYVTIQKVLYDETNVSKFMCFGGGTTNVEVEYVRDTYCVNPARVNQSANASMLNQSSVINQSNINPLGGPLYPGDIDPNENPENIIEMRYQVDNTKNKLKVDEVIV